MENTCRRLPWLTGSYHPGLTQSLVTETMVERLPTMLHAVALACGSKPVEHPVRLLHQTHSAPSLRTARLALVSHRGHRHMLGAHQQRQRRDT